MFSRFFRRTPTFKLSNRLAMTTLELITKASEQSVGNKHFASITVAHLILYTAGHFITNDFPRLKSMFAGASQDVIAFEVLAFSAFAVREYYFPEKDEEAQFFEPTDVDSDDTLTLVIETFRTSNSICCDVLEKETGTDQEALFIRRQVEYTRANDKGGMKGATEVFRYTLQSIGTAAAPKLSYGMPSLELMDTVVTMTIIHAFASTIPKGAANSLRALADHYGFFQ